jgi:hypothetical protein
LAASPIVDDFCARCGRCFCGRGRISALVYRPGEICQWDLWEPSSLVPVGYGQERRAPVVVACLGYSRSGAGALIFSKEAPNVLWGMGRCLWSLGALPELMVRDEGDRRRCARGLLPRSVRRAGR